MAGRRAAGHEEKRQAMPDRAAELFAAYGYDFPKRSAGYPQPHAAS